jgi:hypothetical protein
VNVFSGQHTLLSHNDPCCPFIFDAGGVPSRQKYHVIVGHDTVMAEATFFGLPDGQGTTQAGTQIADTVLRYHTLLGTFPQPHMQQQLPQNVTVQYSTVQYCGRSQTSALASEPRAHEVTLSEPPQNPCHLFKSYGWSCCCRNQVKAHLTHLTLGHCFKAWYVFFPVPFLHAAVYCLQPP